MSYRTRCESCGRRIGMSAQWCPVCGVEVDDAE